MLLLGVDESLNYSQAVGEKEWEDAMKVELDAIEKNNTWKLVELPSEHTPIGLKWVFKLKRDAKGEVIKHKLGSKGVCSEKGNRLRRGVCTCYKVGNG